MRTNFGGANFSGANLWKNDLSGVYILMTTNLCEANLHAADLSAANLSGVNLSGANLSQADFPEAILRGVNLSGADVTHLGYLDHTHGMRAMRGRYQGIRGLESCYGNRLFVRDAADQDYLDTIESELHTRLGRFGFWCWGLIDYGRSFLSVVAIASILIFGFGLAYRHWPEILRYGDRCPTGYTPFYFSIVTYTTLGFGDVKPASLPGEILVSIEVIMGYVTLGLPLAVLADKIARRS